jgi:hypothetical protein
LQIDRNCLYGLSLFSGKRIFQFHFHLIRRIDQTAFPPLEGNSLPKMLHSYLPFTLGAKVQRLLKYTHTYHKKVCRKLAAHLMNYKKVHKFGSSNEKFLYF